MAPRKPRATNGNGNGKSVTPVEELIMIATPEKIETPPNINVGFANILDDEPDLTFEEACKLSGCLTPYELQEYLESLLPDLDVWGLKTIPACYKPQLAEIKRSIEAQNSVKKLEAESSAQHFQVPVEAPEIPLIEDAIPQSQQETSALTQAEIGQLAQGHAEQEAETLELESLADEMTTGGKLEGIQEGVQEGLTFVQDYRNAVRQTIALGKAQVWAEIAQDATQRRLRATNSSLSAPTKAAELRKQLETQKADFLKKDQAIKTAWENRSVLAK